MNPLKYLFLSLIAILAISARTYHPIKISFCQLKYTENKQNISMVFKLFKDDFIQTLSKGKIKSEEALGTQHNGVVKKGVVHQYLMEHFSIKINGQVQKPLWKSMELSEEHNQVFVKYYLPYLAPEKIKRIEVKNQLIIEEFPSQTNIVKIRLSDHVRKNIEMHIDKTSHTQNF